MKYAILFVIAFILFSIAVDVGAIRQVIAPQQTIVEKAVGGIFDSITNRNNNSSSDSSKEDK